MVDITERKRSEEKIQEQANLLELAHDAIFVRSLDEKIQYWNKGAEQLYGWTAEQAIGGDFGKMACEDGTSFEAAKKILLEEGSWSGEVRKLTKARREVVVASRWTLLLDGQGNPSSILAIDTDITEKRQMEAQFRDPAARTHWNACWWHRARSQQYPPSNYYQSGFGGVRADLR